MAAAHVQYLGASPFNATAATTTVLQPASKTVTVGNIIIVGWISVLDATVSGITDNLGNTYAHSERIRGSQATADLWYALVTAGGTITAITATHSSIAPRYLLASEFSGVGTLSSTGAGSAGSGTAATWVTSKTIPAGGIAVGVVARNNKVTFYPGSSSGTPSTSISESGQFGDAVDGYSMGLYYALGGSGVTTFTGTTTWTGTANWAGAGGLFNPAAAAGVSPNFIPFFWA